MAQEDGQAVGEWIEDRGGAGEVRGNGKEEGKTWKER